MIKKEQLVALGSKSINADKYLKFINATCIKYNIVTEARISMYLAHLYIESGNLSLSKENLKYSAKRMTEVWPARFPTIASAQPYANNPEKLAEKTYGGRGGNPKNMAYKYIGRGLIQITFYDNYQACGESLNLDLINHPELLEEPQYAALSAGWYWNRANLNSIADEDNLEAVKKTTKKINGGYGHLIERQKLWKKAKTLGFKIELDAVTKPLPQALPEPLPNVLLPFEEKDAVIEHNPQINKNIFTIIIEAILKLFKKS